MVKSCDSHKHAKNIENSCLYLRLGHFFLNQVVSNDQDFELILK
jgi:hypothetical protein